MCGTGNTSHAPKNPTSIFIWLCKLVPAFFSPESELAECLLSSQHEAVKSGDGGSDSPCLEPHFLLPCYRHIWTFDFPIRQVLFLAYKQQYLQNTLFIELCLLKSKSSSPSEGKKLGRATYLVLLRDCGWAPQQKLPMEQVNFTWSGCNFCLLESPLIRESGEAFVTSIG